MPPLGLPKLSSDPVLVLPFYLGTLRDYSGYGNHAEQFVDPSGHWETVDGRAGIACTGSTDRVKVNDATSLNPASASTYFWGMEATNIDQSYLARLLAKVGSGDQFEIILRPDLNRIYYYDSLAGSSVTTDFYHAKTGCITVVHGGTGFDYYENGAHIGTSGESFTLGSTASPIYIGGDISANKQTYSPIQCVLMYPTALSATEVKKLHDWMVAQKSPSKQWPGAGIATAQPNYRDSIQSSLVSLGTETAGKLSNTGYTIQAGSWKVIEVNSTGEKYIEAITAGRISRRSESAFGSWEFEFEKGNTANQPSIAFVSTNTERPALSSAGYTYALQMNTGTLARVIFTEKNGSSPANDWYTNTNYVATDSVRYKFRVTRSGSGEFTTYIKGGVYVNWTLVSTAGGFGSNPFTDTTTTNSVYMVADFGIGDRLYLDRHYQGVITP